jgi:hypothetical protein
MPVTQMINVSEKPLPGFISGGAPKGMLIDGEWAQAESGETFETVNPATGSVIATVASGGPADVDRAVAAARRAFENPSWVNMNPHDRTLLLLRIADALEANAAELAELESMDGGIPIMITRGMVADSAKTVRYYAGWPTKVLGTVNPVDTVRRLQLAARGRELRRVHPVRRPDRARTARAVAGVRAEHPPAATSRPAAFPARHDRRDLPLAGPDPHRRHGTR